MSFLDKFFSWDYILIQAGASFLLGFIYIVVASYLGNEIVDGLLYFFAIVGFFIGSFIKIKVIESKEK